MLHFAQNVMTDLSSRSLFYKASFGINAGIALESTLRLPFDVIEVINSANPKETETHKWNLSADLGGALFYGACALNVIPYSAILGATIFTIYAIARCNKKKDHKPYLMAQLIGKPIRQFFPALKSALEWSIDKIVIPVFKLLGKLLNPIGRCISSAVKFAGKVIKPVLNLLTLPRHPIWYALFFLGTAALAYRVGLPALASIRA